MQFASYIAWLKKERAATQFSRTHHPPLVSPPHARLSRLLLPLFIAAFSQGLVLWSPIEKVFLNSLGFDQAALGLMAACYTSLIPLLDLTSGILADRWSRKGRAPLPEEV